MANKVHSEIPSKVRNQQLSSTTEDYLKTIFALGESAEADGSEPIALGRIAQRLGVTAGTVTTMMQQLATRGLVDYLPRRGVRLSGQGRALAVGVVRRHRIVEQFLVEVMAMDWADVHEEAEQLEHAISERLLERMNDMLGRPTHDPHGDPIPAADGEIAATAELQSLQHCGPGAYRLIRVLADTSNGLEWLNRKGFRPGNELKVLTSEPFAGTMALRIGGQQLTLSYQAAALLMVEPFL
jgi:DtxR family Mn-dependent transcriptional regulator